MRSQKCKCGSYSTALGVYLKLHRTQKVMALQSAGWSLRGRQAESSKLELQLKAVPSSLTSTYKLFILPLHAVAIGFHVPISAKYDCSTYLPIFQRGSEAHLQLTSHASSKAPALCWAFSSVLILIDFLLPVVDQIIGKHRLSYS